MARASPAKRLHLDSPMESLSGVGPKRAAALRLRGIGNVEDLLFRIPRRYEDWRDVKAIHQLTPGAIVTVNGVLEDVRDRAMPGAVWKRLATATLRDSAGGRLRLVWF